MSENVATEQKSAEQANASFQNQRVWARELCLMTIGGWIFATLFLFFVANNNFSTLKVESLRKERVEQAYHSMPAKDRPMALKYCANELNRQVFTGYGWAQLAPAILCLVFISLSRVNAKGATIALVVALLVVLVNIFYITPQIVKYGEIIEFLPRNPKPEAHKADFAKFGIFHGVSFMTYFLQLACLIVAALSIILQKKLNSISS